MSLMYPKVQLKPYGSMVYIGRFLFAAEIPIIPLTTLRFAADVVAYCNVPFFVLSKYSPGLLLTSAYVCFLVFSMKCIDVGIS